MTQFVWLRWHALVGASQVSIIDVRKMKILHKYTNKGQVRFFQRLLGWIGHAGAAVALCAAAAVSERGRWAAAGLCA